MDTSFLALEQLDVKQCICNLYFGFQKPFFFQTFNIGPTLATICSYRNPNQEDNDSKTNASPLKCGPVYLHHSSTKETYDIFFGRLESLLNTEIDGIEIIGQPIFGGYMNICCVNH